MTRQEAYAHIEAMQAIQCGERAMARGQYRYRSFWICVGRAWLAINKPHKEFH
jgi:hypothetical protein